MILLFANPEDRFTRVKAHIMLQICFWLVMRDTRGVVSVKYQARVVEAFNCTSRYLDDLLNIDNPYFEYIITKEKRRQ